jgi:hypothetical protein
LRVNEKARAIECALRYFRSWEHLEFAEQSDTTHSLHNRMEKVGLVSNTELWMSMRNVRPPPDHA